MRCRPRLPSSCNGRPGGPPWPPCLKGAVTGACDGDWGIRPPSAVGAAISRPPKASLPDGGGIRRSPARRMTDEVSSPVPRPQAFSLKRFPSALRLPLPASGRGVAKRRRGAARPVARPPTGEGARRDDHWSSAKTSPARGGIRRSPARRMTEGVVSRTPPLSLLLEEISIRAPLASPRVGERCREATERGRPPRCPSPNWGRCP